MNAQIKNKEEALRLSTELNSTRNVRLWRNVRIEELLQVLRTNKVVPRLFRSNPDSDAPFSKCSFWFSAPIVLKYADAIIEAEVDADKAHLGRMRFSHVEDWPHAEIYREYEIEEVYVVTKVTPLQIWIAEDFELNLWDLDIDECETEYGFNPWELEENELKQKLAQFPTFSPFLPQEPFLSLIDAAKITKEIYKRR